MVGCGFSHFLMMVSPQAKRQVPAFQAAGVVERLLAILVTLVQRSGANQDELVELFVRRIINKLDMCIGLIDFVLVQRQVLIDVHREFDITHSAFIAPLTSLNRFMKPTPLTMGIMDFFMG